MKQAGNPGNQTVLVYPIFRPWPVIFQKITSILRAGSRAPAVGGRARVEIDLGGRAGADLDGLLPGDPLQSLDPGRLDRVAVRPVRLRRGRGEGARPAVARDL